MSGFNFAVPTGATIKGYRFNLTRKATQADFDFQVVTYIAKLLKGGSLHGNNAASFESWPTTASVAQYGGQTEKLDTSFSPTDINAGDFGAAISANVIAPEGQGGNGTIESFTLTVFFEE